MNRWKFYPALRFEAVQVKTLTTQRNGSSATNTTEERTRYLTSELQNRIRGSGLFINKSTPQGELRWRSPSGYFRRNIALFSSDGECRFVQDGATSYRGIIKGPAFVEASDDITFINLNIAGPTSLSGFLNLNNQAYTRALLKMKDQKVNLSVAAAEVKSSASMLAQTAMTLYRAYRAARKGNWKALVREFKPGTLTRKPPKGWSSRDASGRWLEVQYGWKPLVSDLNGTIEWLNTSPAAQLTFKVTGSAMDEEFITRDRGSSLRPAQTRYKVKRVAKSIVHYQMVDYRAHNRAQAGLVPTLSVGWELVPYSFVIDWFLGVGSWLETFDATVGKSFISGTITNFVEADIDGYTSLEYFGSPLLTRMAYETSAECSLTGKVTGVYRGVLSSFPRPLPVLKNPLSTSHVLNAIALVRQLRRR